MQSQLRHLCLPKQHPGLGGVKKTQKALSGARGARFFLSLYSSCCMCCPCSDRADLALLPSAFLSLGFPGLLLLSFFQPGSPCPRH